MENPIFTKPMAFMMAAIFAVIGFMMLPGPEDIKEGAFKRPVAEFLSTFHAVSEVDDEQVLPETILLSSENRKVELKALTKGRVTIINFWASWCAPCLEELPSLARFQQENPDILIMPVSLDMQKTMPELAKIFKNEPLRDLRWFYDETGVLRKSLSLPVYPSTYVLDKEGKIIYILQGPSDWGSENASVFGRYLLSKS